MHGRSGVQRLNWCSPGWYWLSCTGRQVQRRAWRGWSALVVGQRSARERICSFRKHSERRHAERVLRAVEQLECSKGPASCSHAHVPATGDGALMAPAGPLSVCRSRTPTGPVGGASLGKWCFEYPDNFRAPVTYMAVSNTRKGERHKQGGFDPVGEARTCSWSVASVGPPAASGLCLGEAYITASMATNAHPRFQC